MAGYGYGEARRVVVSDIDTWVLVLPWVPPPLSSNQRLARAEVIARTAMVRDTVVLLARAAKLPRRLARVRVQLVYAPASRGRRDADNLVATLKPACDGLVRYGLVDDDVPELMVKPMPVIVQPVPGGRLWLVVTDLGRAG